MANSPDFGRPRLGTEPESIRTARDVAVRPARAITRARISEIRASVGLSQVVFAKALNVSPDTIRGWEQGKREPDGASLRLLELAERHPRWILESITELNHAGKVNSSEIEVSDDR